MSSSTSPVTQRGTDVKLVAIITSVVLVAGFCIAGSILFLTRGGSVPCSGQVNAGSLPNLVTTAKTAPSFVVAGGNCQYWLALRDGHMVAIKPKISAMNCTVDWKPSENFFSCNGSKVTYAQLEYFPTSVGTGAFKGSWIIDFGNPVPK